MGRRIGGIIIAAFVALGGFSAVALASSSGGVSPAAVGASPAPPAGGAALAQTQGGAAPAQSQGAATSTTTDANSRPTGGVSPEPPPGWREPTATPKCPEHPTGGAPITKPVVPDPCHYVNGTWNHVPPRQGDQPVPPRHSGRHQGPAGQHSPLAGTKWIFNVPFMFRMLTL